MTTPAIYRIAEKAPVFPCWCRRIKPRVKGVPREHWSHWRVRPDGFEKRGFTHWSPDSDSPPNINPQ